MRDYLDNIRKSYNAVAQPYAHLVQGAAAGEDEAIELLAEHTAGTVLDAGCGPGRLTGRLRARGLPVIGLDLSFGMIEVARRDHPDIPFVIGSITDLPFADAGIAGVISWWSLIHLPRTVLPRALAEFHRVLRPSGPCLLGLHAGEGSTHKTSGYGGHPMDVHVHRWQPDELTTLAKAAGFTPHPTPQLPRDVLCLRRCD